MEHVFVINPVAGKGRQQVFLQKQIKEVFERLQQPYEIYITQGEGDAINYVRQRSSSSNNIRFYACGGDGTLNEVVNGAVDYPQASVTVVPCGTGNDFIKQFPTKTGFLDIEALLKADIQCVDLLKINQRWTVNMCNIGFDANVAFNASRFKRIPFIHGSMAYTLAIFYSFFKKIRYPLNIEVDGQSIYSEFLIILLANGSYYGGGYQGAPYALVDDGLIDFLGITGLRRFSMLRLLKTFKYGQHMHEETLKNNIIFNKCRSFKLSSVDLIPVCLDGDIFHTKALEAELVTGALKFAVPR